jgi:hypothetical protein
MFYELLCYSFILIISFANFCKSQKLQIVTLNLVSSTALRKPRPSDQTWLAELCLLGRHNFEFEIFSFMTRIIEKSANLGKYLRNFLEEMHETF